MTRMIRVLVDDDGLDSDDASVAADQVHNVWRLLLSSLTA